MKHITRRRVRLALLALLALVALVGCQREPQPEWKLNDVSGHLPDLDFRLTDDNGKAVTGADFRGKVTVMYFGYTHCPDVCPLTLTQLHVVLDRLGAPADRVRILFVSVDPARDTPAIMHAYVNAFDKRAVGLVGSDRDVEALAKRYRSAFTREPDRGDGNYEVSHSSAIYIFDGSGKARLLATPSASQDDIVHDLHLLTSMETTP
ncbi:protein SCO1/2 [Luteibacter sp. UNCMF331Sha3.1]|uniref:SCO family protein n=1 Tax=Luteibacter sp. UNCMF331Sha3.1 TaxID=1502760 RepID=UPI0008CEB678|nr:SCO family protein [Luteibacter sp. UNCMF331Sha3.1]SEM91324.1 protein SCO1/2 [Luteibacter sp. UNCMF331Sha3.1]